MFTPSTAMRIWLCTHPTDMRKSFTGLVAQAKNQMGQNPLSGNYFVFVNQRKTQMKILYFEPSGYCLWSQRLEQGQYRVKAVDSGQCELSRTDLQWLLDGIEVKKFRQYKRYRHPREVELR